MAKIAFIGGGNMASCIFKGIVTTRANMDEIYVSGPHLEKLTHFKESGAHIGIDNVAAANNSDVIFLGVKPQKMLEVLTELKQAKVNFGSKLVISMAAGWRISAFFSHIGVCPLIRIMPSTPAKIGLGVTSVCSASTVSSEQLALCLDLLKGLGLTIETTEDGINSLGALAGSAPAFIFRFMEALQAETMQHGFSEEQARTIVEQVFLGSASLAKANHDTNLSALREAVTSKGGTTYQGLLQMSNYHFESMVHDVIEACLRRTREFEAEYK